MERDDEVVELQDLQALPEITEDTFHSEIEKRTSLMDSTANETSTDVVI